MTPQEKINCAVIAVTSEGGAWCYMELSRSEINSFNKIIESLFQTDNSYGLSNITTIIEENVTKEYVDKLTTRDILDKAESKVIRKGY